MQDGEECRQPCPSYGGGRQVWGTLRRRGLRALALRFWSAITITVPLARLFSIALTRPISVTWNVTVAWWAVAPESFLVRPLPIRPLPIRHVISEPCPVPLTSRAVSRPVAQGRSIESARGKRACPHLTSQLLHFAAEPPHLITKVSQQLGNAPLGPWRIDPAADFYLNSTPRVIAA